MKLQYGVEFKGIKKCFASQCAIEWLDTQLPAGKIIGLAGPDGAGKTTLMRCMAGLMMPDEGEIVIGGLNTAIDGDSLADSVGYMPQKFGLYEDLSVQENLNLYADLHSVSKAAQPALFDQLLKFTRLAPFTERLAGHLSGGMKQKLGLACALMAQPNVLLLDEPGVGVDPVSRQHLWEMMQSLTHSGMTVVWATAYLDEAEQCDHVLLLNEGKSVFEGVPADLTQRLQGRSYLLHGVSRRRRLLTACMNQPFISDAVIQGDAVRVVLQAEQSSDALMDLQAQYGFTLQPAQARFEDAFIDVLGGVEHGESSIAASTPEVVSEHDSMVRCHKLTRYFGDFTATNQVSFEVKRGEIFGLLGPNGAGKSTTFRMLCGLLGISSGVAEVVGHNLASHAIEAKKQLGYMAQKFSLYSLLSVAQNLDFSASVYGLRGKQKGLKIAEMVDVFELKPFLDASPNDLSLGYKQRLALACSLMHNPKVLFLDEPTSGVDPITRREFWKHINGLADRGVTVMVTTHFMDEAEYCDSIALMYQSRVIALDSPDRLKAKCKRDDEVDITMEQAFIRLIENEETV